MHACVPVCQVLISLMADNGGENSCRGPLAGQIKVRSLQMSSNHLLLLSESPVIPLPKTQAWYQLLLAYAVQLKALVLMEVPFFSKVDCQTQC